MDNKILLQQFRGNVDAIKQHLKTHGGLLITNRCSGKTQALIELIHEDTNKSILTFDLVNRDILRMRYKKLFNDGGEERIHGEAKQVEMSKTFIDDYMCHHTYYKIFAGAVSTMIFPIAIKKYWIPESEDKIREHLTEKEYQLEFGLEFSLKEE